MNCYTKYLVACAVFILLAACKKEEKKYGLAIDNNGLPQGNYHVMEFRFLPDGDSEITQKYMTGPFKPANLDLYRFTMDSAGYTYNYKFNLDDSIGSIEIVDSIVLNFDVFMMNFSDTSVNIGMIGIDNPFETIIVCTYVP